MPGSTIGGLTMSTVLFRLLFSMLLGALLGTEREYKQRPAGLRTYMIVCISSSLVMLTGQAVFSLNGIGDPSRLAAQVVSGIGFLGAGTIVVTAHSVIGLTTAAGLWASACIGLAVGAGFYVGGVVCAVLVAISMSIFHNLDQKLFFRRGGIRYCAIFRNINDFYAFLSEMQALGLRLSEFEFSQVSYSSDKPSFLSFSVHLTEGITRSTCFELMKNSPYIQYLDRMDRF